MQFAILFGIAFAIAGVVFALQNNVPVTVTFLLWRFDSSLALVLLFALALGAITVALVSAPDRLKLRWTVRRRDKQVSALEQENRDLKGRLEEAARSRLALAARDSSPKPLHDMPTGAPPSREPSLIRERADR